MRERESVLQAALMMSETQASAEGYGRQRSRSGRPVKMTRTGTVHVIMLLRKGEHPR